MGVILKHIDQNNKLIDMTDEVLMHCMNVMLAGIPCRPPKPSSFWQGRAHINQCWVGNPQYLKGGVEPWLLPVMECSEKFSDRETLTCLHT